MKSLLHLFLVLLLFVATSYSAYCSHIVGGTISYSYLSPYKYIIRLDYYKDCSASAADFPPGDVKIGIYGKTNNFLVSSILLKPGPIIPVDILSGNCVTSSVTCVQKRIYQDTLEIDSTQFVDTLGYYMSYEQCCRNFGIRNINRPDQSGLTFYADFPALKVENKYFINSSPELAQEQNLYLCVLRDFYADYSYNDIDGDSLVYSIVEPIKGNTDNFNNNGSGTSVLNPAPYPVVDWNVGYGVNNFMDGNPDVSIDSSSGLLHVKPTQQGLYSVAIKVEEYRAGIKIAEIRREIQYQVIFCPASNPPETTWLNESQNTIKPLSELCLQFNCSDINNTDSLSVNVVNLSTQLSQQEVEVFIDNTQKNPVGIEVCIRTNCDVLKSSNEGFQIIVNDNSCPYPNIDTFFVSLNSESLDLTNPFADLPNVFTPNKDGINDFFRINKSELPGECIKDFTIEIFNRWGESMYKSNDYEFNWDGSGLASGVYFYVVKLGSKIKTGNILIMY